MLSAFRWTELPDVAGGDINAAYRAELSSGLSIFVKTNPKAPPGLFTREAAGLEWLEQAGALRVAQVLVSAKRTAES